MMQRTLWGNFPLDFNNNNLSVMTAIFQVNQG